ncbi:MAG: tetratricopeptide repeat protein, partial [Phycisphaerales bacterium]
MNPQRYQQIYDLFTRLRELSLEARKSILDRACADDAELRREVEAMLSADAHPLRLESWPGLDVREGLQDETATDLTAATPPQMPKHVGHYSIRRVIATGGMGTVYEAVQEHPHRTVALKVLRGGIASRSALRRFEHESQILGRLRHPNIAQVYEAGMHDEGTHEVPYFAMEYIPNARTLTEYTEQEKPDHRQRLELFIKICDAVYHGHQKGIIHRDLKPANILIDSAREPKIIDFGVARTTDADMAVTTLQTDVGQLIGTLQYMSPEQCAADPHDLDSRSDVYALGVVLYELLCERLPYDVTGAPLPEAVRMIREETPVRPSTIERRLRGDTETIVLKALAKERDRRYRSAAELADDIKRHLHDEPILARPPSAFYQLRKFARRNKVLVGSVAAILIVLVAAVAVSTTFAIGEARARDGAEQARAAEEQQRKLAEQREKDATEARELAQQQADQLETVTDFQESMLSDMDAEQMGRAIVHDQRERVRQSLEAYEASPERIEASMASFDELAALINPTDLALKVVDEQVLSRALQTIEPKFADQPLVEAALRRTVAGTYRELGLYPQALSQAERVLALRRRELGTDHPDTLRSISDVGQLLQEMGKLTEAEPYCREALEGRRRVLGDDDPDTLWSINYMGMLLCSMGKLAEAESYCREALEGQRRVLGEGHQYTRESINTMGYLLSLMGKHAEAEPYFREGMEISRGLLGEDHPETLTATGNLGELLRSMGRFEEAEPYLRAALDGFRRERGNDHPKTLSAANNMGLLLHSVGRLAEAEPYYR